jgi:hypothetical protein
MTNHDGRQPDGTGTFHDRDVLSVAWQDICIELDQEHRSWSERFTAIRARMDRIDTSRLPETLKCPVPACYRRTVIGARHTATTDGFEGVLAHWRAGCDTPIHGHPPIVMYAVLTGHFRMYTFRLDGEQLVRVGELDVKAGEHLFHVGEGAGYDHFIHRVECLEPGWTLNLYSDDARKGLVFGSPS